MVELDIQIKAGDLYDYMLMHSYHGASGIIGSAFGAVMVIFAMHTSQWIFLIGGLALLLYLPWVLLIKSREQIVKNPVFKQPLHYRLDEKGLTISQGESSTTCPWADMVKAVSTGRSIILYTSRINATIFPRRQMGEKQNAVIQLISAYMPPDKVKVRG